MLPQAHPYTKPLLQRFLQYALLDTTGKGTQIQNPILPHPRPIPSPVTAAKEESKSTLIMAEIVLNILQYITAF